MIEIVIKLLSSLLLGAFIGHMYVLHKAVNKTSKDIASIKELDSRRNS